MPKISDFYSLQQEDVTYWCVVDSKRILQQRFVCKNIGTRLTCSSCSGWLLYHIGESSRSNITTIIMVIIIIAAAHDDGYDGLDDADCDYIGGGQDGDDGEGDDDGGGDDEDGGDDDGVGVNYGAGGVILHGGRIVLSLAPSAR